MTPGVHSRVKPFRWDRSPTSEALETACHRTISSTRVPTMADLACTLTPDALAARRAGLLSDLLRRTEGREDLPEGLRLRFAPTSDTLATSPRSRSRTSDGAGLGPGHALRREQRHVQHGAGWRRRRWRPQHRRCEERNRNGQRASDRHPDALPRAASGRTGCGAAGVPATHFKSRSTSPAVCQPSSGSFA